jgi:hypothetical protein
MFTDLFDPRVFIKANSFISNRFSQAEYVFGWLDPAAGFIR